MPCNEPVEKVNTDFDENRKFRAHLGCTTLVSLCGPGGY